MESFPLDPFACNERRLRNRRAWNVSMRFHRDDALIVVDVQRDFCPGGALEIAGGGDTVPIINRLMADAAASGACIVASRDWHPKDHASFNPRGGVWPEH